jgi:para-aminobenzoate synthetase / 4-amino-4-deoxychorismate lyase
MPYHPESVLLHDVSHRQWLRFDKPVAVLRADALADIPGLLAEIEEGLKRGLHAAGMISYDASPAFDNALTVRSGGDFPLAWFVLCESPTVVASPVPVATDLPACPDVVWRPSITEADHHDAVRTVREYIRQGDTYQTNYTFRLNGDLGANHAPAVFEAMLGAQQADFGAYVDTGDFRIASASPELFFQLEGDKLVSRPMKGTAPRDTDPTRDRDQANTLASCTKNRAENVMIVDMIRNDMGRIAKPGSVHVPSLFDIEAYPTVWQMTSEVHSQTDASFTDILHALFPCASITGAPKARTMEIIAELETTPRSIYTGSIGFISPDRRAQFNVVIRTLVFDVATGRAQYGTGGGIVWDSTPDGEYLESLLKARVLTHAADRS